ncbi:MAG: mechanosensitive ion channel family protein [Bacilli bacterium]|nr:mechanosensitive ion channel family protein [Bacilli bacterium]
MEKKKVMKIVGWVVLGLLAAGVVVSFVFDKKIFGSETVFLPIAGQTDFINYLMTRGIPAAIRTVQIVVIAILAYYLLSLLAKITFESKKTVTVALLLLNLVKWVVAIASVFLIMGAWGADTTLMLASAGVLTLIIGLGSQALVQDILAGIFIVFEGDFQVGDIVVLDGWRGEVKAIGIRTTKLVDAGGNIKIMNNSDIRSIVNQTKELSVAKCYVGVSYGDRIEAIEKVIADNLPKIKEKIPAIIEGPFYKGVSELGDSAVVLLFVAKCKEPDIYQVQRDLNREIKIVFDDNNVNIPFPQVTVSYDQGSEGAKLSTKDRKAVEAFVEEQKDLSKDIDDRK